MAGSLLQRRPDIGDRAAGALLGAALAIHRTAGAEAASLLDSLEWQAQRAADGALNLDDPSAPVVPAAVLLPLVHLHDEAALHQAAQRLADAHRRNDAEADQLAAWCVALQRAVRGVHLDDARLRDPGPDDDAAMAGALAGGRRGASAVPFASRRALDRDVPRLTGRLARAAMRAVNGGAPVEETWPLVPMLAGVRLGQAPFLHALDEDPGVVLGNLAALPDAVAEVDAVVSLCLVDAGEVPEHLEHHEIHLVDRADAAANPNLSLVLADTASAIATLREEGQRVLVHCLAGRSRTPTVVAAYLARHTGLSGPEAFARVAAQVPHPDPLNRAFQQALERIAPRDVSD